MKCFSNVDPEVVTFPSYIGVPFVDYSYCPPLRVAFSACCQWSVIQYSFGMCQTKNPSSNVTKHSIATNADFHIVHLILATNRTPIFQIQRNISSKIQVQCRVALVTNQDQEFTREVVIINRLIFRVQ